MNVLGTIAFCVCTSSCGIPVETGNGTFTLDGMDKDEFRRNHQNPSLMAEEIERDRSAETNVSIEKQNKKDAAAREKHLNEIIDKGKTRGTSIKI